MGVKEQQSSRKADHWQRKYYDSLKELEQKELEWQELEKVLRLLVSRLTLIAATDDAALEKQLDRLRDAFREGRDIQRLRPQIDELARAIAKTESSGKANYNTENPATALAVLLDELNIPKALQRQEKHLRKRLQRAATEKDIPDLVKDMAELLGLAMAHIVDQRQQQAQVAPTEERQGLLSALFGKKSKETTVDTSPPTESTEQPIAIEQESGTAQIEHMEISAADDMRLAAETLILLLEKLELPHDLGLEAALIRQRLEPCDDQDTLTLGLEATADLVADAHARTLSEKKALEEFLRELTARLQEIDTDLQETARIRERSANDTREMNQAVQNEVQGMERSVDEAEDLTSLQTAIQSRVIIIRNHMDRFLEAEEARNKDSKTLIEKLTGELQDTEDEVKKLREQIEEERKLAMTDALTELANRKAYDQQLLNELARFKRYHAPFVLMVWDVDHFKSINDNYGHAAGDKVLKIIAGLLKQHTRETDLVARYGGEEFVILMPETRTKQAAVVAEKLREKISKCAFHFRNTPVEVTASCGFTESLDSDSPEIIFKRADDALYRAKESGRNRCESA